MSAFERNRLRRAWLRLHRWLGLSVGVVFAVVGLTGSMLAFWPELDPWVYDDLYQVTRSAAQRKSLDDIVNAGRLAIPADGKPYALVFPNTSHQALSITYSRPAQNPPRREWHQVFVDPYTAHVTGERLLFDLERPWRGSLFDFILRIHYTLALGAKGATLVGCMAAILLLSVISGVVLWWPSVNRIRSALTIKPRASRERRIFDLHKSFGIYSALLLSVSLVSGLYLVFPEYITAAVNTFAATTPAAVNLTSAPAANLPAIGFERVASIADQHYNDGRFKWIFFPQSATDVYRVVKRAPEERTQILPARTVWIDQYTGSVLHEFAPRQYTAGDSFQSWLYPLHTGEAFGWPGRILIMLLGLVPATLLATGYLRWQQKRRSARFVRKTAGMDIAAR